MVLGSGCQVATIPVLMIDHLIEDGEEHERPENISRKVVDREASAGAGCPGPPVGK